MCDFIDWYVNNGFSSKLIILGFIKFCSICPSMNILRNCIPITGDHVDEFGVLLINSFKAKTFNEQSTDSLISLLVQGGNLYLQKTVQQLWPVLITIACYVLS